jgi:hypothetical protein
MAAPQTMPHHGNCSATAQYVTPLVARLFPSRQPATGHAQPDRLPMVNSQCLAHEQEIVIGPEYFTVLHGIPKIIYKLIVLLHRVISLFSEAAII